MTQINLTFKENFIESFTIAGDSTIGSDPTCDIHIDSLAVQPNHATLVQNGDEYTIASIGSDAEILINGAKVTSQQLKDGDQIQIGKHTLEFIAATAVASSAEDSSSKNNSDGDQIIIAPSAPSRKKEAFLQVLNGSNVGKTISLTKNMTNLGKPGVQTAIIARREDGYFLSHLEGEKSPSVNTKPIGDNSYELKSGDSIQIGNVKLLFSLS